jgi:mRNA interferase HigB
MRIIEGQALREFFRVHSDAESGLCRWYDVVEKAAWRTPVDVRATFSGADIVRVASGNCVVVFNVGGGKYRVIAAIQYKAQRVYVRRVFTHAEYDMGRWRDEL